MTTPQTFSADSLYVLGHEIEAGEGELLDLKQQLRLLAEFAESATPQRVGSGLQNTEGLAIFLDKFADQAGDVARRLASISRRLKIAKPAPPKPAFSMQELAEEIVAKLA